MPTYFPCPNTQCSYQFDADILPAAAMVTCPLCRTKFPYRANRPVPAPAARPAPADDFRPPGPRLVHLRDVPRGGGLVVTLLSVGGFVIVLSAVLAAVFLRGQPSHHPDPVAARTDEKFNLSVDPFPPAWGNDPSPPTSVDANVLVRKRSDPEGWVAVAAKDWADRQPRAGEVDELMRGRLRAFRTLEVEPIESPTWAGHSARAVRFSGSLDDVQVRGEAYAFAYQGVGYVFYTWAAEPSWDRLRDELVGLREKVRPAGFREHWVERRVNVHVYEGDGYQVEDSDGVWVQARPPEEGRQPKKTDYVIEDVKSIDPAATMAFLARYQIRERGDALRQSPEVMALVVELERKDNPLEAATAHVIERSKRAYAGEAPDFTLEAMAKSPSGIPLPVSGPAIGRFRLKDPTATGDEQIWIISAITVGDKVVAVEAHVPERFASYVEEWMVHLAGSLKAK
ncbi:MAG TPA: hypothetical protein VKD90_16400 [Gemmataceae bacterium]|nr:hypothetical protein [Gemmataceae bacterium]